MKKERLMELAGISLSESSDEGMFQNELTDIYKAIRVAWDRAKSLDMEYEDFLHTVKNVTDGALQDLE